MQVPPQITPELVLLRAALPVPALRAGSVVVARVLDQRMLSLAGSRVAATLPEDVKPGDVLRLRVQEAGPERVVLQIVPSPPPASTVAVALPGGAFARVIEDEAEDGAAGGRGSRSVVLRYDSPVLGRLDIRLSSAGAVVHASEGPPADAARAASGDLAAALGAPVAVIARRSALDARA
jgi:hypothetical protein